MIKQTNDFDNRQQNQIIFGMKQGLDASIYAKPEFNFLQMA